MQLRPTGLLGDSSMGSHPLPIEEDFLTEINFSSLFNKIFLHTIHYYKKIPYKKNIHKIY